MPAPKNPYYLRSGETEDDSLSIAQEETLEAAAGNIEDSDSEDNLDLGETESEEEVFPDDMAQRVSLTNFNGEPSERGDLWWAYFDKYAALHGYNDDKKKDLLPFFLGKHARVWYDSLPEGSRENLRDLKAAFISRFTSIARDLDMYTLSQGIGETCSDYFSRCQRAMVGRQCPDEIQVMTVIRGLLPSIQPQVLLKAPKTMEETREAMLLTEMAASRFSAPTAPVAPVMQETDPSNQAWFTAIQDLTASVNAMRMPVDGPMRGREPEPVRYERQPPSHSNRRSQWSGPQQQADGRRQAKDQRPRDYVRPTGKCGRCNGPDPHPVYECPARGNRCQICNIKNHFTDMCNSPKAKNEQ